MKNKILSLLFILLIFFTCSNTGKKPQLKIINIVQNEIKDFKFIKGMKGLENIYLEDDSLKIYATGLDGTVYIVNGESYDSLKVIKSKKLFKESCLDIEKGPDDFFYISGCDDDWQKIGGYIIKTDNELNIIKKITSNYSGINGLCFIEQNLYFASGNITFINPAGNLYKIEIKDNSEYTDPIALFKKQKATNGLFYNNNDKLLYFTDTLKGVYRYDIFSGEQKLIFGKSRIVEGFDDLCIDSKNRFWVGDQPNGCVKMFDPDTNIIYKISIEDIGVITSCKIREENGKEILYMTEMKKQKSKKYDGRGIIIIPIKEIIYRINMLD